MKKLPLFAVLLFVFCVFTNCESDLENEIYEPQKQLIDKDDVVTPGEKG